jgi:hypothetical protein
MLGTLKLIRETWGSVEECVIQLGLLPAEGVEQLRRNLIMDTSSGGVVDWRQHAKLVL